MNIENHSILQHYIKLTEFLGRTLGPDYEIVLHSLEDKEKSIIAIANNHVSGQELGAPLASEILQIIADKSYHNYSYRTHYMGVSALGKKLIGLCHPDTFVETNFRFDETYKETPASQGEARSGEPGIRNASAHPMSGEAVPVSSGETVNEALSRIFRDMDLEGKSLSQSQRLAVMERLERDGVFLLKGAVKDASGALGISQASVYRYLSRIRQE